MVLEATVVCLDNSEYLRNGDFAPTRFDSQLDAVNLVCGTKIRDNPENSVACLSFAGNREVLTTLTTDLGKIITCLHRVQIMGEADFLAGLQIAQLVLKHRQVKTHRQRIVIFVGSPIESDEKELVKVAKKLKKNNISVDVISFGEEDANTDKLEAFMNAVNKEDNSHLLTVPSGATILSDAIISSPILAGEGGAPLAGNFSEFGGVDPSMDPELAMVLRISMEEERQRMEQTQGGEAGGATSGETPASTAAAPMLSAEDAELQAALALSMGAGAGAMDVDASATTTTATTTTTSSSSSATATAASTQSFSDVHALSEEEQLRLAMEMSMPGNMDTDAQAPVSTTAEAGAATEADLANDDFLRGVLGSLEGVDADAVLKGMKKEGEEEDKKEKK